MDRIINYHNDKTIIIITHDKKILDKIDKKFSLEKGKLIALK